MAARKKAVKKTLVGSTKPHTTAILKSVEIAWSGKKGNKKMKVDLKRAGGIYWGNAGTIAWQGDKRTFPEAGLATSTGAPVMMKLMSAPGDPALCWWDEVLQQWVCPEEPDES